jgi:hypothetical protein
VLHQVEEDEDDSINGPLTLNDGQAANRQSLKATAAAVIKKKGNGDETEVDSDSDQEESDDEEYIFVGGAIDSAKKS